MISYLLPTRNRPDRAAATLRALGAPSPRVHEAVGGAEVVVIDDASSPPVALEGELANGMPVRVERRRRRDGAAARNAGARLAWGDWLVMLDDDSAPLDEAAVTVIASAPDDVVAIGAEIFLPDGRREAGGLPEVFVGCGAAIRRGAFLGVGGYDPSFHYYAEEYDLCARLLMRGWRIIHDWRFRVRHEKTAAGRDMDTILRRLVRNNGWVVRRYAPPSERGAALRREVERYGAIAGREHAEFGYHRGLDELMHTIDAQPHRTMSADVWRRFTGLETVCAHLAEVETIPGAAVAVTDRGRNAWVVDQALRERGDCRITDEASADVHVIGTLSPGPMTDAWERRSARPVPVVRPWRPLHAASNGESRAASAAATDERG